MPVAHEERFCCTYGPDSKGQLGVKYSKGQAHSWLVLKYGLALLSLFTF